MKMELSVISNYGQTMEIIAEEATPALVRQTMRSLDWHGFHQVILTKADGDWLEVGGSLAPGDGLSVMYEERGEQFVIEDPPETVEEMTAFLLDYLAGSGQWRGRANWV
jgi:hypothetical protein